MHDMLQLRTKLGSCAGPAIVGEGGSFVLLPGGIFKRAEGFKVKREREGEDEEANDPDDLKGTLPDFFLHQLLTNQTGRWLHLWRIKGMNLTSESLRN
jgi:hypothetical protein